MRATQPNSIWLVIDSNTFGGIETHVLELADGLSQHNEPVAVVFLKDYGGENQLEGKLEARGVPSLFLNRIYPKHSILKAFHELLKVHSPTVVHAHGYKSSIITKLAKVSSSKSEWKQISTYHAGETPKGRVWLYDALDRYTSFISDHSLAVSNKIQKKLISRSKRLNNFINLGGLSSTQGSEIAFVGRMSHEKAPDRFMALAQEFPDVTFHCYGSGPMEDELRQANSNNNVLFHGHQTNMEKVWKQIDVLIICSRYEGLPMAALEAMARGIVVIAMDVGDLAKLIEHQDNGFIGSNMQELKNHLSHWLNLNAFEQNEIRTKAQLTIEKHYSQQAIIPQFLSLYHG
ncbi:glycosyltransferase family 4 protein [Vibrio mexicanus]|uniref:glycosyltransferase family 4 protein n=1 Tax=Vibrio mexicanus TaxID=1004326 RepID=UPI00063C52F4|nr:glycosyltransferase family 4 protein [Vibrio mexicanus]